MLICAYSFTPRVTVQPLLPATRVSSSGDMLSGSCKDPDQIHLAEFNFLGSMLAPSRHASPASIAVRSKRSEPAPQLVTFSGALLAPFNDTLQSQQAFCSRRNELDNVWRQHIRISSYSVNREHSMVQNTSLGTQGGEARIEGDLSEKHSHPFLLVYFTRETRQPLHTTLLSPTSLHSRRTHQRGSRQ